MSDPNLIRLCKVPSDLGVAAGRSLYLDPDGLTLFLGPPPDAAGANGASGGPVPLADFLTAHPEVRDGVRAFLVGRMTGRPAAYEEERREQLGRLMAGVTDENRHEEVDWGPPVGREVW